MMSNPSPITNLGVRGTVCRASTGVLCFCKQCNLNLMVVRPINIYEVTKLEAENLAISFADQLPVGPRPTVLETAGF